jgi:pimeloyl-ACP methyl ester carboxylesterase
LSFVLRAIPLSFLGRWGSERINRMVFDPQPIPEEVNEVTTLTMNHFKSRIGVLPIFSDEELQRLTMPTLLLIGKEDALRDARKIAERMRKLVPQLTAMIIPQAGHALYNRPATSCRFWPLRSAPAPAMQPARCTSAFYRCRFCHTR